jgi:predicted HAD superfamily Cof-like phosphohydrolase
MSMLNTGNDVATFLEAVGQTVNENVDANWEKNDQAQLYMKLVVEEFEETAHAWNEGDSVELADGCADLIWVLQGLMLSVGIPMQEVWDEVARSNLAKIDPETGVVLKREDGKILKPAGWTAPDIKTIIDASLYAEASQTFKG